MVTVDLQIGELDVCMEDTEVKSHQIGKFGDKDGIVHLGVSHSRKSIDNEPPSRQRKYNHTNDVNQQETND